MSTAAPAARARSRSRDAIATSVGASIAVLVLALAPGASAAPHGRTARSLAVKDEGYLRLVRSSGSLLYDEGHAHGTIPGTVKIHFVYNGDPSVTAQITIYGHAGSIQAHADGRLSSPTSTSPSFAGSLTITGGSGRYAHAHGAGHLYGVFYRRSYAMLVQTQGTLRY